MKVIEEDPENRLPFFNYRDSEITPQFKTEEYQPSLLDPYGQALYKLSETAIPNYVCCRQRQRKTILDFIKEGIQNLGQTDSLYISGIPGIGKTLTVSNAIETIKAQAIWRDVLPISLNGTRMPKAQQIYTALLRQLVDKTFPPNKALFYLNQIFSSGILPLSLMPSNNHQNRQLKQRISKIKVMVIDEVDFLLTKSQDILYNIFQWIQLKNSKIVLLTISNTVDFPQRLEQRILSRINHNRLVFKPYTSAQMEEIMKFRLKDLTVFEEEAVTYTCKKVAKFTPDVRKCLHIMQQSIKYLQKEKKTGKKLNKVTVDIVSIVHKRIYDSVLSRFLPVIDDLEKKTLLAICHRIRATGKSCLLSQIRDLLINPLEKAVQARISKAIMTLKGYGLITVCEVRRTKDNRMDRSIKVPLHLQQLSIELIVGIDEVLNAFADEINYATY